MSISHWRADSRRIRDRIQRLFYRKLASYLWEKDAVITRSLVCMKRPRVIATRGLGFYSDYIRLATLELCATEIKRRAVPGVVAELGVYRGDFARKINEAFPDRTLHLFDTFQGFVKKEIGDDIQHGLARKKFFILIDPKEVLKKMPHPHLCELHIGAFTSESVKADERFAFVSIDVDLSVPTTEGLRAFWPKLESGGYIFLHDYNNDDWKGIEKAVNEFLTEEKIGFVPLPDAQGSLVIVKP